MGLEPIQKRSELFSPNQLDTPFVFFYVFTRFSQISSGVCIYCTYHVSTALYSNTFPLLSSLFKRLSTRFSQVSSGVYIYLAHPTLFNSFFVFFFYKHHLPCLNGRCSFEASKDKIFFIFG